MVSQEVVHELLQRLVSGSPEEQAAAAKEAATLCWERRGYSQARGYVQQSSNVCLLAQSIVSYLVRHRTSAVGVKK